MKILVIGSGGREHAVCEKFKQSKKTTKIFALPGNAGIAKIADCITNISLDDHFAIINFCKKNKIDFVFIGPEKPLVDGLADDLRSEKINAFGPSKYCANLEGSKSFMKKIADENGIPTAIYKAFEGKESFFDIEKFAKKIGFPCVVKADGLASGKGVIIVQDSQQLEKITTEILSGKFGGKKFIVEEFLIGVEASYFVISDGKNFISLGSACDHKKVGEGESGANTGGMGTFAPSPFITKEIEEEIIAKIISPTLDAMKRAKNPFVGILFAGIILTDDGAKLLEFNTRLGDPETQVILPLIKSDFVDLILSVFTHKLDEFKIEFDYENKLVCVVMCANGYPDVYTKNTEIKNLNQAEKNHNVLILHAGTAIFDNKLIATGGRVLNIVAKAKSFKDARIMAYEAIDLIDWKEGFVRRDIAKKVE
jgi:phosphoribosylamine--glycine ligase